MMSLIVLVYCLSYQDTLNLTVNPACFFWHETNLHQSAGRRSREMHAGKNN